MLHLPEGSREAERQNPGLAQGLLIGQTARYIAKILLLFEDTGPLERIQMAEQRKGRHLMQHDLPDRL
ncbi:hypothetical protein D3C73_1502490 [compost metagenome]